MIIAVDLDNTINNFAYAWLAILNRKYKTSIGYDKLQQYDMTKNFPLLKPEQVNEVFSHQSFWYTAMKPQLDSVEVLKYLSVHHEIYVVTAREYPQHQSAIMWLKLWFPFIPEHHIIFAQNKSMVRCDVLIDDCPANLVRDDCVTIQFVQPWNASRKWGTYAYETWNDICALISDLDKCDLYPGRTNRVHSNS